MAKATIKTNIALSTEVYGELCEASSLFGISKKDIVSNGILTYVSELHKKSMRTPGVLPGVVLKDLS